MNAKTAKRLRRAAMGMAVAAEQQGHTIDRVRYQKDKNGTITISKQSYRGAYLSMKKALS